MLTSSPQGQGATRSCAFLHSTDPSGQELVQASLFSKVALKMLNLQETVERILLRKIQTVQQEEFRFAELQLPFPANGSQSCCSLSCLFTHCLLVPLLSPFLGFVAMFSTVLL